MIDKHSSHSSRSSIVSSRSIGVILGIIILIVVVIYGVNFRPKADQVVSPAANCSNLDIAYLAHNSLDSGHVEANSLALQIQTHLRVGTDGVSLMHYGKANVIASNPPTAGLNVAWGNDISAYANVAHNLSVINTRNSNDLSDGLKFATNYVNQTQTNNPNKIVIIVTDGTTGTAADYAKSLALVKVAHPNVNYFVVHVDSVTTPSDALTWQQLVAADAGNGQYYNIPAGPNAQDKTTQDKVRAAADQIYNFISSHVTNGCTTGANNPVTPTAANCSNLDIAYLAHDSLDSGHVEANSLALQMQTHLRVGTDGVSLMHYGAANVIASNPPTAGLNVAWGNDISTYGNVAHNLSVINTRGSNNLADGLSFATNYVNQTKTNNPNKIVIIVTDSTTGTAADYAKSLALVKSAHPNINYFVVHVDSATSSGDAQNWQSLVAADAGNGQYFDIPSGPSANDKTTQDKVRAAADQIYNFISSHVINGCTTAVNNPVTPIEANVSNLDIAYLAHNSLDSGHVEANSLALQMQTHLRVGTDGVSLMKYGKANVIASNPPTAGLSVAWGNDISAYANVAHNLSVINTRGSNDLSDGLKFASNYVNQTKTNNPNKIVIIISDDTSGTAADYAKSLALVKVAHPNVNYFVVHVDNATSAGDETQWKNLVASDAGNGLYLNIPKGPNANDKATQDKVRAAADQIYNFIDAQLKPKSISLSIQSWVQSYLDNTKPASDNMIADDQPAKITYTYTNYSRSPLTNATINAALPANLVTDSGQSSATLTIDSLPIGSSGSQTLNVKLKTN